MKNTYETNEETKHKATTPPLPTLDDLTKTGMHLSTSPEKASTRLCFQPISTWEEELYHESDFCPTDLIMSARLGRLDVIKWSLALPKAVQEQLCISHQVLLLNAAEAKSQQVALEIIKRVEMDRRKYQAEWSFPFHDFLKACVAKPILLSWFLQEASRESVPRPTIAALQSAANQMFDEGLWDSFTILNKFVIGVPQHSRL